MSHRLRHLFLTAALALPLTACDRGSHPEQLGQTAPIFAVNDGQHAFDLAKYRGHVVLLNFWASWCAPCLQELPSLEALTRQMPQVTVIGVSFDTDRAAYDHFLTLHHVTIPTVIDPSQHTNSLYGTYRPPETDIIDKTGQIRRKFIGPQDWTSPEIQDYLTKLTRS